MATKEQIAALQNQLLGGAGNYARQEQAFANLSLLGANSIDSLVGALGRRGSRQSQQDLIDAVEMGRQSRYSSGGGGSSTPHFAPMPAGPSGEIVFEGGGQQITQRGGMPAQDTTGQAMPKFQSMFGGVGPTAAQQQELAKRQAMRDELLMEAEARALGTIAGREGAGAQASRQLLGVPPGPGYENLISEEEDRVIRGRIQQASAHKAEIEKIAKQPGTTQAQIDDLQQQYEAHYPDFADGQRPKTRGVQLEERQTRELAAYQQAVGNVPLARNHRGEIAVIPGYSEMRSAEVNALKSENERLKAEQQSHAAQYAREMALLRLSRPTPPSSSAFPAERAQYEQAQRAYEQRARQITDTFFPQQQSPAQTTAPQPAPNQTQQPMPDAPVIKLNSADEIADGLSEKRWQPGTVIELEGMKAVVDESGMYLTPLE